MDFVDAIVPLGICVVLPITIVGIVMNAKKIAAKEKFSLLHKAIEHGVEIDPELLIDRSTKTKTSLKMRLLYMLLFGVIFTVIAISEIVIMIVNKHINDFLGCTTIIAISLGLGFLVTYIVGRKQFQRAIAFEEMEAEKKLGMDVQSEE